MSEIGEGREELTIPNFETAADFNSKYQIPIINKTPESLTSMGAHLLPHVGRDVITIMHSDLPYMGGWKNIPPLIIDFNRASNPNAALESMIKVLKTQHGRKYFILGNPSSEQSPFHSQEFRDTIESLKTIDVDHVDPHGFWNVYDKVPNGVQIGYTDQSNRIFAVGNTVPPENTYDFRTGKLLESKDETIKNVPRPENMPDLDAYAQQLGYKDYPDYFQQHPVIKEGAESVIKSLKLPKIDPDDFSDLYGPKDD